MKTIMEFNRKVLKVSVLIIIILSVVFGSTAKASQAKESLNQQENSALQGAGSSQVEVLSPYFSIDHMTFSDGTQVSGYIINGPSKPLTAYKAERLGSMLSEINATILPNFPSYNWVFGCSAVSGSMIAGYYDQAGFPNMYTGSTNGGVMPVTDTSWPLWSDGYESYPNNPLVASHDGVDGRTGRGSIDDYWVQYESTANDPYITNGWIQHTWGTAIGDFMKTSQSAYNNSDGSTHFYNWTSSPNKLTCADMVANDIDDLDGTYGRKLFYEARGYSVGDCYNQKTDNNSGGFTLANFQAEINAGNPVLLNLAGHSIVGYGYNGSTIYLRDTWDNNPGNTYTMPWGGSYQGMQLLSVSVVRPVASHPTKVLFIPLLRRMKIVNQAPTNLLLSNSTIEENKPINTVIGSLSSVDPNNGDTYTYSLVPGSGDTGNASFNIAGSQLRSSVMFDYETQNSYSIRLRTTDQGGLYFEKVFTITITQVIADPIQNGNFELGPVSWVEYSTHGWPLITQSFPGDVTPYDGSWAVWLGGEYDDVSYIQQQVTIPTNLPYLSYWHWIASADSCGYDFGGVLINGMVVEVYNLCSDNNTSGWVQRVVNLSAYAGSTVTLEIRAETDGSFNSNLFIDHVTLQASGELSSLPLAPGIVFGAEQTKADTSAK